MPDYSEVEEAIQRRLAPGVAQATLAAHARGSRMVALKLDELLKSDEWNTFIAHLKALQEIDEAARDELRRQIESGGLGAEELYRISSQLQRVLGRIERGQQAVDLPKAIIATDQQFQASYTKSLDNAGKVGVTE